MDHTGLRRFLALAMSVLMWCALSVGASAQGAQVAFGGLAHDPTLPIEVTADMLEIDQADGSAMFTGNVVIGQGSLRLTAGKVRVEYATEGPDPTGRIARLIASGGVTFTNGSEAVEARRAIYDVTAGTLVLEGDVILTQGRNALSGDRLVIDLARGTGRLEGRVRTILQPGGGG